MVSKNKRRFIDEKYNLDLTYITPKLIAMSFPGSGMQKLYRNSIDTVAQFLNEYHPGVYKLFNLSQNKFNVKKFNRQVAEFSTWRDHHSPPMDLLVSACDELLRWMLQSQDNIGVVNCDAGKGRTGTFISCFLIYSRRFSS